MFSQGSGTLFLGQEGTQEAEDRSQVGGASHQAQQRPRKQSHFFAAENQRLGKPISVLLNFKRPQPYIVEN